MTTENDPEEVRKYPGYPAHMTPYLEKAASGEIYGRDPRKMSAEELTALGYERMPLLKAIRLKCLDCSHTESEVRKCTAVGCSLWPYRMNRNPFVKREANPNSGAALAAWREKQKAADDE
jgi:hypothetical protein